jgi:hypothetical protein
MQPQGNLMKLRRQFLHLAAGAAALPAMSRIARAQSYPTRPIRLVVPFPPGGAFDTLARPWVEQVKTLLGTVIIENIGGGGSSLGAAAVACGRVKGTIRAVRVKLQNGGAVEGDIFHRTLSIDENSQFEGSSRRVENPTEPSSSVDAKGTQKKDKQSPAPARLPSVDAELTAGPKY